MTSAVNKTSQLDLNASYIDENSAAVKQNLTTLSIDGGTTAQEIVDVVVGFFESNLIPLSNIMVITTDDGEEDSSEDQEKSEDAIALCSW